VILLVGLGNPGPKYAKNRHNIGFMGLDAIARRWNAGPWRQKFRGEAADVVIDGAKALLLKPLTYMNESGNAVGEAMRFHRIDLKDVIVFHDELDLAPAKLRVKTGGGNAGHNGLRSITQHCQNDYIRVRMGIGHPGHKDRVHAYVLNDFAKAEEAWVDDLCRACADFAPPLVKGDGQRFQSDVAAEMQRRSWGDVPVVGAASA
jgi:peptidyl-tRNA hydrolase, PTH1 family